MYINVLSTFRENCYLTCDLLIARYHSSIAKRFAWHLKFCQIMISRQIRNLWLLFARFSYFHTINIWFFARCANFDYYLFVFNIKTMSNFDDWFCFFWLYIESLQFASSHCRIQTFRFIDIVFNLVVVYRHWKYINRIKNIMRYYVFSHQIYSRWNNLFIDD